MAQLPFFGLNFDVLSVLSGVTLTVVAGWVASLLALRKDERAVQMEQVTKERTKWRDTMRKTTEEIALTYFEDKTQPVLGKVAALRARLATSINPKDKCHDQPILTHFDDLFSGSKSDLDVFTRRIALLLKHDWERVKWECSPIYAKPVTYFTNRKWRAPDYRNLECLSGGDCLR